MLALEAIAETGDRVRAAAVPPSTESDTLPTGAPAVELTVTVTTPGAL